jgi:hypothetical protein
MKKIVCVLAFIFAGFSTIAFAQEVKKDSVVTPRPRTSPMAVAFIKTQNQYIKVVYSQPFKRGREVFGDLEPYGEIWRTGANEATEITITKDVKVAEKLLKAGTYTLFSIPAKDKWTIIFNTELGQWGAFKYDKSKDILKFDVPVSQPKEIFEAFTIKFNETKTGADMLMAWDKVKVVVPFTFSK